MCTAVLGTERLSSSEIRSGAVLHQTGGNGGLPSDAEAGNVAWEIGTNLLNAIDNTRIRCLSTHEGGKGGHSRQNEVLHDS